MVDSKFSIGIVIFISIAIILSVASAVMPHLQTAGNSLTNTAVCSALTGSGNLCNQNQANATNSADSSNCTFFYTGTYAFDGNWGLTGTNTTPLIDNNISTCVIANDSAGAYMQVRYFFPVGASAIRWNVTDDNSTRTLTIPDGNIAVVNATHSYIDLRATSNSTASIWTVYNGILPTNLSINGTGLICEEKLIISIPAQACSLSGSDCIDTSNIVAPGTSCTGYEPVPLGNLFSGTGIIVMILMAGLVIYLVSSQLKKK